MKKIIVILSSLALFGGVSNAMEEGAGDEMMMEAPAPSVTVGASAKIGVKSVDDDSMPDAESIHLVREYKVTFDSSGTTDGGLMFGAGISIIDEHEGGGDVKAVGGSKVYVGAADGSWKLQFGGNDPGALVAGGIGVADDAFDRGAADISLSGAIQGVEYRLTMADPQNDSDDWSLGAKYGAGTVSVGIGLDSEEGYAIGATTDLAGLETSLYYSKSEWGQYDNVGQDSMYVMARDPVEARARMVTYSVMEQGHTTRYDWTPQGGQNPVSISYYDGSDTDIGPDKTISGDGFVSDGSAVTIDDGHDFSIDFNKATGRLMVTDHQDTEDKSDDISYYYQIDVASVTEGRDAKPAVEASEIGYTFGNEGRSDLVAGAKAIPLATNVTSIGAKVAIPAGENAKFILGYSQAETELTAGDASATRKDTKIEMDFEYGLGGGATFVAGIDKDDLEQVTVGADDDGDLTLTTSKFKSKTTLEAVVKFSF